MCPSARGTHVDKGRGICPRNCLFRKEPRGDAPAFRFPVRPLHPPITDTFFDRIFETGADKIVANIGSDGQRRLFCLFDTAICISEVLIFPSEE